MPSGGASGPTIRQVRSKSAGSANVPTEMPVTPRDLRATLMSADMEYRGVTNVEQAVNASTNGRRTTSLLIASLLSVTSGRGGRDWGKPTKVTTLPDLRPPPPHRWSRTAEDVALDRGSGTTFVAAPPASAKRIVNVPSLNVRFGG